MSCFLHLIDIYLVSISQKKHFWSEKGWCDCEARGAFRKQCREGDIWGGGGRAKNICVIKIFFFSFFEFLGGNEIGWGTAAPPPPPPPPPPPNTPIREVYIMIYPAISDFHLSNIFYNKSFRIQYIIYWHSHVSLLKDFLSWTRKISIIPSGFLWRSFQGTYMYMNFFTYDLSLDWQTSWGVLVTLNQCC